MKQQEKKDSNAGKEKIQKKLKINTIEPQICEEILQKIENNYYVLNRQVDRIFVAKHMQEINVFIYEALLRGATTQEEFGFQDCQKIEIFKATNRIKGGLIILAFFPPMLYWARGNIKILKPLFALLAFTTLRILEEYSFYLHYYSHAARLLNTMLKFDTKKSFLGIETHLFVKYCVWQDILKQRKLIPAKKYTDLLFIRPIYLRFNDIRQKIKHWRHYFKRRQLQ